MHKIFCYFHNVYHHKTHMILIIKSVVPYAPCVCLTEPIIGVNNPSFFVIIIICLQSNGLSLRTSIIVLNRILMGIFPTFQISCGMKDGK